MAQRRINRTGLKDFDILREMRFKLTTKQEPFFLSNDRFPAFVAGWGTGKTLSLILKGITLSTKYHNNLGMIFRKTETSLRASTIKDFEDYTNLRVTKMEPQVMIPGTGSKILFGHADDMKALQGMLQNVNLGWVGIEQAEEMRSASAFDMLRGRLRRILTPRPPIQQKLIRLGVLDKTVKDFREIPNTKPEKLRDKVVDALIHKLGEPYHQLMSIANTQGHNWMWRRWKKERWPEYRLFEANSFDNSDHLLKEDLDDWERLKIENPKRFARMVMNSWEDYDLEGAYYAELMSDALKAGRVDLDTLYDVQVPVYTFWDLGIRASDTTAIWFVQFIGQEIWLIDYHESFGKGMEFYSNLLSQKPYTYAAHYLPPDVVQRMQGAQIDTRLNIFQKMRREPVRVVSKHRVEERIAASRGLINRCKFSSLCERGVDAMNNYRKKKYELVSTEETPVFMSQPQHDVWSNGADAFGYMAIVKRYQPPKQDDAYNYFSDDTEWLEGDLSDEGITDLLSVG